jgi:phospholipid/cholesterol/gamma-HCH transport system ATP-binding protein
VRTETLDTPKSAREEPETEISIRHLTKRFGKQTVLEDLTFDIPKGKVTLILGPSGTGKSVFLKNVMGLLKPENGEIWIGDKNVPALGHKDLYEVRRKFGVLFQDGALFGSMSVYDNTAFPLREHTKKPEREIKDIVMEKLQMVGLVGAEEKLPGEISGGMKKRAGLARALVLDPEIIMFDEPDSGLDPVRTAFLNELILDLNRKLGSTMVVVTHDIATARRVADYIGMLYLRNLVQFDSKENMFNSDIPVVRQFLAGATDGPIGMSEEADQGRQGGQGRGRGRNEPGPDLHPWLRSSFGMTAEETEAMERDAGAPPEDRGERTRDAQDEPPGVRWMRRRPGRARKPVRPTGDIGEQPRSEEAEAAQVSGPWLSRPQTDRRERTATHMVWRRGEGDVLPDEEEATDVPLQEMLGERDAEAPEVGREEA